MKKNKCNHEWYDFYPIHDDDDFFLQGTCKKCHIEGTTKLIKLEMIANDEEN